MKFWTGNNLKSENGSALIMALFVILTLGTFATVSLMTSVANIQMSSKYRNWSKDYYTLDKDAENKVNDVNEQLENAETNAQKYMAGHYYTSENNPSDPSLNINNFQDTVYAQWLNIMELSASDTVSDTELDAAKKAFMANTLTSLYYYYSADLLQDNLSQADGFSIPQKNLAGLFSNNLDNLKLAVNIDTIDPSVEGKAVSVTLNVQFPTYKMIQQTQKVIFKGNPIWTNAITAAGSIGFTSGTSSNPIKIYGDLFSADTDEFPGDTDYFYNQKDQTPLLNDNYVLAFGVYSKGGANAEIYGNVNSRGNLHVIGSDSQINVHKYRDTNTTLKNNVYSNSNTDNLNDKLFFDYAALKADNLMTDSSDSYIEGRPSCTTSFPLINEDISGGNVYCYSLSVDGNYADQDVNNGAINVDGNVTTFNDIKMDGLQSEITVAGNYIGINSETIHGDPNASSTVINNTALSADGSANGSEITLNGKFIVPGTAYAQYAGVKKNEMLSFIWPSSDQNDPWLNKQYYQTGESITARSADIYGAYMAPITHPLSGYTYSFEPFTNDHKPQSDEALNESEINPYYLMRGQGDTSETEDSPIPKMNQLANYLNENYSDSVVTNIFSGFPNGYSFGEALLHIKGTDNEDHASLYGPFGNSIDNNAVNYSAYSAFRSSLYNTFVSKTWNLGTVNKLASSFGDVFVDKSVIFDEDGNLKISTGIDQLDDPSSFAYINQEDTSPRTLNLNITYNGMLYCDGDLNISGDGMFNGIIYCVGNLKITGSGKFNGAIICEGNVEVSDNPTISYDEKVIESVMVSDGKARQFFAPGAMGVDNKPTSTMYDGAVRTDVNVKRFQIVEWREEQQP
ncbi:DUF2572 family protein [Desulfosporosinus sp. OT]|uniref:DUF2572 family protein n=1 Tax=Desulfosporosinus sp. OT TaxID=913865 RepID=UPI000223ABEF|nr:DUF2572 family protein [Desulfosporosinus sp. OT]EGW40340.1 hypothetical protein DOT_1680 [Desulfosporosinus sp. OT]